MAEWWVSRDLQLDFDLSEEQGSALMLALMEAEHVSQTAILHGGNDGGGGSYLTMTGVVTTRMGGSIAWGAAETEFNRAMKTVGLELPDRQVGKWVIQKLKEPVAG